MGDAPSTGALRSGERVRAAVIAWRTAHALVAAGFLTAIGYVWWCALSGRRGRFLRLAMAALIGEAALVAANRGACPLGPVATAWATPSPCSSWCSRRARHGSRCPRSEA